MAKDPAFLFYSQDFIVGTNTMNFEDRGKYISILAQMHQQGRMDEETIRFLVGSISDKLKMKFSIDDSGLWYNKRLEEEIEKRAAFVDSRRENGKKGGRPKKPNGKPNGKPTHNLSEDVNENEIDNINKGIPTKEEVRDYFKSKGYKSESANKAFDYYETLNWHDRDGNPVKNWKNKMVSVWFKDENRDQSLTSDGKRKLAL